MPLHEDLRGKLRDVVFRKEEEDLSTDEKVLLNNILATVRPDAGRGLSKVPETDMQLHSQQFHPAVQDAVASILTTLAHEAPDGTALFRVRDIRIVLNMLRTVYP
jgi:hypothetical protein